MKIGVHIGAAVLAACLAEQARGYEIVIDFQELECAGPGWAAAGAEYSNQGFTFSDGRFLAFCTGDSFYAGSMGLFNDLVGGQTTLTADSGEPFALLSIDVAPVLSIGVVEVRFVGYLDGVEVAEQTFVTSSPGRAYERFEFSGDFAKVDRVVVPEVASPLPQFDNVTIGIDSCYADCDGSGELDFFDFLCYQELFGAGDPGADCDSSGVLDFFDFLCFQTAFAGGCE